MTVLGLIGGSGFDPAALIANPRWVEIKSPFGQPSDAMLHGDIDGLPVVFLPRHGRGHVLAPGGIDYRANIDALKRAGVTDLVTLNAVGSLREQLEPGSLVLVDQFIDLTRQRVPSFFGNGCVAHVPMSDPVCSRLGDLLATGAETAGIPLVRGATYVSIEGPQYSTRAEDVLYRSWGADLIGMTNMPEAKLAREAELCFAALALVTDYSGWYRGHAEVDAELVLRVQQANAERTTRLLRALAQGLRTAADSSDCACRHALDHAIVTAAQRRDPALLAKLDAVAGRVLKR